MELGKGIAIVGIWIGLGLCALAGADISMVAIAAMVTTVCVALFF